MRTTFSTLSDSTTAQHATLAVHFGKASRSAVANPLGPRRMPWKWDGFLPDVAGSDADFFRISHNSDRAPSAERKVES
jgi:hypothetical protein